MIWTCKRCAETMSSKRNLICHLRRTIPCKPYEGSLVENHDLNKLLEGVLNGKTLIEKVHICPRCEKEFKYASQKSLHLKKCEGILHMKNDVNMRTNQCNVISHNVVNNINNINNVNNVNNINNVNIAISVTSVDQVPLVLEKIREIGNERLDHISDDFKKLCLMKNDEGLFDLFEKIHYDPRVPENRNIRHKSKKQKMLEIYKDDRWVATPLNAVLDDEIKKAIKILNIFFVNQMISDSCLKTNMSIISKFQNHIVEGANGRYAPAFYYGLRNRLAAMIHDMTQKALFSPSLAKQEMLQM